MPNPREQCNAIFVHSDTTSAEPMLVQSDVMVLPDSEEIEQIEKEDPVALKEKEEESKEAIHAVVTRSRK